MADTPVRNDRTKNITSTFNSSYWHLFVFGLLIYSGVKMNKYLLCFLIMLLATHVHAQSDYPNKPVTIVVPVPAGGATDKTIRLVARFLQNKWKNGIVIENRAGASGNIASAYAAKAPADGYTLIASTAGTFAINPNLFKSLEFDTRKDFSPITQISTFAAVLLVHESLPVKNYAEFTAMARNSSEPLSYATSGSGSAQHLAMEKLRSQFKLQLNHIPYKGGAPAMNDLLAGHVKVMMAGMGDASAHLNSSRIRPLATTGKSRSPLLPQIPTFSELGVMDFDASGWHGLHAPAGTPVDIIAKINADVTAVLTDPNMRQLMASMDVEPRSTTVNEFKQFLETQFVKWKEAAELSGAKAD